MSRKRSEVWRQGARLFKESSRSSDKISITSDLSDDAHEKEISEYISKVKRKTGLSSLWGTGSSLETRDDDLVLADFTGRRKAGNRATEGLDSEEEDLKKFIEGLSDSDHDDSDKIKTKSTKSRSSKSELFRNVNVLSDNLSDREDAALDSDNQELTEMHFDYDAVPSEKSHSAAYKFALDLDDPFDGEPGLLSAENASVTECISESSDRSGGHGELIKSINSRDLSVSKISGKEGSIYPRPDTVSRETETPSRHDSHTVKSVARTYSNASFVDEEILTATQHDVVTEDAKSISDVSKSSSSSASSSTSTGSSSSSRSSRSSKKSNSNRSHSRSQRYSEKKHRHSSKTAETTKLKTIDCKDESKNPASRKNKLSIERSKPHENLSVQTDIKGVFSPLVEPHILRPTAPVPTSILDQVVDSAALHSLSNHNPSVISLNDIMKFHLHLTHQYIEDTRRLYHSYSEVIRKTHKYTTLKGTMKEIKKRRTTVN